MSKKPFLTILHKRPILFDGAMGTMIYDHGIFINTCYDELNLTNPMLITDIHREYAESGVDVLETNSFGANRIRLSRYGLADKVTEINRAAVDCVRRAASPDTFIAGAIGPCTTPDEMLIDDMKKNVCDAFSEQIAVLFDCGIDLLLFETFSKVDELALALDAAQHYPVPVAASFAVGDEGKSAFGTPDIVFIDLLNRHARVDIVGLNCGTGPSNTLVNLEHVLAATSKPVIVMPNAGLPKETNGRTIYLTSPEYFTEYARRYVEMGARGVGGCCGTTPAHISMMTRAIKPLHRAAATYIIPKTSNVPIPVVDVLPSEKKSRLASKLLSGKKITSIELLPPRSIDMTSFVDKARICAEAGIDAINIPDGPRASTRISPLIAAITVLRKAQIEPVLHYCCRDRNLIGMQADLLGACASEVNNLLLITGDPPKLGGYPDSTGVFNVDSIGLTQAVNGLNHGMDIGGNPVEPATTLFIGVGANPCAIDLNHEIDRYCRKIDAGAEFVITQPVFDTEMLYRFLERTDKCSRRIPVVAGVWPLVSYANAEFMNNEVPGVVVPEAILKRLKKTSSKDEGMKIGGEIAGEIIDEIAPYVQGIQVSAPFGKVKLAIEVLKNACYLGDHK